MQAAGAEKAVSDEPLLTHEPTVTRLTRGPNAQLGKDVIWVLARCDRDADGYFCSTHQFYTDKRTEFAAHCRQPGDHAVAIACRKHGLEEPPAKENGR